MTNQKVATRFAEGGTKGHSLNMFIEGDTIYSYGYHFPIARRTGKEYNHAPVVLFNKNGYSHTTSNHKGHVYWALRNLGYFVLEVPGATIEPDTYKVLNKELEEFQGKARRARKEWSRESWLNQANHVAGQIEALRELYIPNHADAYAVR